MFTLGDMTGAADVLQDLARHPQVNRSLNPVVAMTIARTIVQEHAEQFAITLIENPLREAYDLYVLTNGEHADALDRTARDNWEAGIDDAVERIFLPYEKAVSANWFGSNVIDTRLHERPATGADAFRRIAESFAREAWHNLIHVLQDGDEGKEVVELSTAKILSAVGIVRSDIEALLAEQPETQPEREPMVKPMPEVTTTLREFIELTGMSQPEVVALLDNALDSDEGLSLSGISQLGGDKDDAAALKHFVKTQFEADAADLYNVIVNGATLAPPAAPPDEDDEEEELAAMMGEIDNAPILDAPRLPTPPLPSLPTKVPHNQAPSVNLGNGPDKLRRKPLKGADPVGAIPVKAWELIRTHVKTRDEDIGSLLGVSRQTFINYSKGKPALYPSPEQRKALIDLLYRHRTGLDDAMKLVSDTPSTT